MLGLDKDIKHCTPKLNTRSSAAFGTNLHKQLEKSADETSDKDITSYRYVHKESKRRMQAIRIDDEFVKKAYNHDLPSWAVTLLANTNPLLPSLYWCAAPKGAKNEDHTFRWRNCREYNSIELPKHCWIVRETQYFPRYEDTRITFYILTDQQFHSQLISEKEYTSTVKCQNIPKPWSSSLWLPYTYLDLKSNKYVLVFNYNHRTIHTNFSDMPPPIKKLLTSEGYPSLDLCRAGVKWYGQLRYNRTRSMRIEMGTLIAIHLDADTFLKDGIIERLEVISQEEVTSNYQKVGV
jgi:hypothetical protein